MANTATLTVKVSPELRDWLIKHAEATHRTASAVIRNELLRLREEETA